MYQSCSLFLSSSSSSHSHLPVSSAFSPAPTLLLLAFYCLLFYSFVTSLWSMDLGWMMEMYETKRKVARQSIKNSCISNGVAGEGCLLRAFPLLICNNLEQDCISVPRRFIICKLVQLCFPLLKELWTRNQLLLFKQEFKI